MVRRIGVIASSAVLAGMAIGSAPAQAQTDAVCVFEGLVGTVTPSIPNALPDALDGNPLDWEQGSYSFSGTAACAGAWAGSFEVEPTFRINSQGYYDNLICGTGFAHDGDGSSTTMSSGRVTLSGIGHQIDFVNGHGELYIGPTGAPSHARAAGAPNHVGATGSDAFHGPISSAYVGRGDVEITPGRDSDPPAARDNCMTSAGTPPGGDGNTGSFEVKGHFGIASL